MTDNLAIRSVGLGDDDRLRDILERTCRTTGMGFAAIARVTPDRWIACQVLDRIDFGMQPGDELDIKMTICNDIRESGDAVFFDDASVDPNWWRHPVPTFYGFKSYVSLPLHVEDGAFFGTLCALDEAPRPVSAADITFTLRALADEAEAVLAARLLG